MRLAQRGEPRHIERMSKRTSHLSVFPPGLAMQLAWTSWEVIMWRSLLVLQNRCSAGEYERMVTEKVQAAQRSAAVIMGSAGLPDAASVLAPWHTLARANLRRLRASGG
jgi:hypothetical protein